MSSGILINATVRLLPGRCAYRTAGGEDAPPDPSSEMLKQSEGQS
jgi:hypothetical protein